MPEISMRCPVCVGSSFSSKSEVFDDRYGEPNRYELAVCDACGHLATSPRLTEAQLPALYGNYYPRKGITANAVVREATNASRRWAEIRRWWQGSDNQGQYAVRPGEVILDVGCGSGVSLLEAAALGADAFGIEADPNVRPIADELGLKIHFGSLFEQPFPDRQFDRIVLNQVIEHLPDPDQALLALAARLKSDGKMVLVFPNTASFWARLSGIRWINWHIPYHLHHFDRKSFEQMANRCGLQVSGCRTITPNIWTVLQLRANRYQASRGVPSPLWTVASREGSSTAAAPGVLRRLARVGVLTAFATVNRVIDALGMGDSLVIELRRSAK